MTAMWWTVLSFSYVFPGLFTARSVAIHLDNSVMARNERNKLWNKANDHENDDYYARNTRLTLRTHHDEGGWFFIPFFTGLCWPLTLTALVGRGVWKVAVFPIGRWFFTNPQRRKALKAAP